MAERSRLVLVTGANGFIGSHLTEALLARGYRVRCAVRRTSDLAAIQNLPADIVYVDLENSESLIQACHGVDMICHCAALTRAPDEETFYRTNTEATIRLARIAEQTCPELVKFLYVSSHTAAGPSSGPSDYLDESCESRPITWYGKSKLAAEQGLNGSSTRLPLTIIRPAAVFGPRDRDFLTYFALVKWRLSPQLGRKQRQVSLIYVLDLVELIIRGLEADHAVGQTYFGCGPAHSYVEMSSAIARAMNRRTIRIIIPEAALGPISSWSKLQRRLTGRTALLNDQRILDMRQAYWLCSGEKARRELGFVPKHGLDDAVRATADCYREAGWI